MPSPCRWLVAGLAAVWAAGAVAAPPDSGWVTLKNDTNKVLIVQEVAAAPNGVVKRGRPIRLLPGETLREFQAMPGEKRVEVFDMQAPVKPLFSGKIAWKADNPSFSITADAKATNVVPAVMKGPAATMPLGPRK